MDDPRHIPPVNALSINDEPIVDLLKRRERELIQQTAAIRGMLVPKEDELAKVRQALQALGIQPNYVEQLRPFLDQDQANPYVPPGILNQNPYQPQADTPLALFAGNLTIKEMILAALKDHFRHGATPSELRDYMRTAYGREIDRNSISPQLARLREEGLVQNANALTGTWELALRGTIENAIIEAANKVAKPNSANEPTPRQKRWYVDPQKKD
jgi:hypothetical protein